MKRLTGCLLLLCLLLPFNKVQAQPDTGQVKNGVLVYADPRLAILTKKPKAAPQGVIRSGRGYRVQIYSGADRTKAIQTKIDFMKRFPGIRTYMTYVQPQFRLKVGDFRSRAEAQRLYRQLSHLYTPCMIVPDIIVINTLRND